MPYDIDPARRLVLWTHAGSDPPGEWTRTLQEILADPRFASGFKILEDSRADQDIPVSSDVAKGIETVVAYQDALGDCRWAVILPAESPAFFGMLRMAEILLEQTSAMVSLRAFIDIDQALAWLDVSD